MINRILIKPEECLLEIEHMAHFIKTHIEPEKLLEMDAKDIYSEYEKYRVASIQDGWGYYSKVWKNKI